MHGPVHIGCLACRGNDTISLYHYLDVTEADFIRRKTEFFIHFRKRVEVPE